VTSLRAFGGGELAGDRLVRFIYIDEAGISAPEPVTVVCGIIVDADKQWAAINQKRNDLVQKHVREECRDGFVFHGKELIGGGKVFPRAKYTLDQRIEIHADVASAPRKMGLCMAIGYARRGAAYLEDRSDFRNAEVDHIIAFMQCIAVADWYIKRHHPGEVAMIIAENNDRMKGALRRLPRLLSDEKYTRDFRHPLSLLLPLSTIAGPVHFAEKSEEPCLQFADACAFAVRRFADQKYGGERLLRAACGWDSFPPENNPRETAAGHFILFPAADDDSPDYASIR